MNHARAHRGRRNEEGRAAADSQADSDDFRGSSRVPCPAFYSLDTRAQLDMLGALARVKVLEWMRAGIPREEREDCIAIEVRWW